MRRFLLSSKQYNGDAEILFDGEGRLIRFDVSSTDMTWQQVNGFKKIIPANLLSLETAFAGTSATVVEAAFEISFKMFWDRYGRKIHPKRCEPVWNKLNTADQLKAYQGIEAYERFLKKENWRPKADPEKYLKDRYWESEWK